MKQQFILFSIWFALILTGIGQLVDAQEPENLINLSPVIVSASQIPNSIENMPGNITVITREEIEERKPVSLVGLLQEVPGLHIDQPGGRGNISSVYLRGSDPNFTLVLIDGVKVNDPTNSRGGSFDFSTINVENIERIEITRGALSSVHGSDAMGGVINIITREATIEPETSVEIVGGAKGYYSGNIETRGSVTPTVNYAFNAAYDDNGDPTEGNSFEDGSFNGKINLFPSDEVQFRWLIRYCDTHSESFPDDSGGSQFAVIKDVDKHDTESFTLGMDFVYEPSSRLKVNFNGSWYHHDEDVSSPGVAPGIRDPFGIPLNTSDTTFRRTSLGANSIISLNDQFRIVFGMDYQFEEGTNDSMYFFGFPVLDQFDLNRDIFSPFMELQYNFPIGLMIQGGMRVDLPEDFDTEYSPRVGLIYKHPDTLTTFRANWAKGFKLPSFFALSNQIVGNSELCPETSETYDFGVTQEFFNGGASVSASIFNSRFFDLIDLEEGPPPKLVNRSEATAKGVELGLSMQIIEELRIKAHLTYAETDIKGTDEQLRNRPKWRGGINLRWKPTTDWAFNFDTLYVGKTLDSSIPTGDLNLKEYIKLDVSAIWNLHLNWQLGLMIDNLLDEDYEEAVGFPAPGITPRISLRFRF
ncbi:MAG: TonB-dependent receptor [Desulfobacterales bacterium]|nr:TonB-dependent receptor [Desulfobacterales bacterium]